MTGCVELFLLACYMNVLITRVYECILPCMFCITMSVTHNAVCNCEIKSILTYLLIIEHIVIVICDLDNTITHAVYLNLGVGPYVNTFVLLRRHRSI